MPRTGLCLALLSTISAQEMGQELAGARSPALLCRASWPPCEGTNEHRPLTPWMLAHPGPIPEMGGAASSSGCTLAK